MKKNYKIDKISTIEIFYIFTLHSYLNLLLLFCKIYKIKRNSFFLIDKESICLKILKRKKNEKEICKTCLF